MTKKDRHEKEGKKIKKDRKRKERKQEEIRKDT